MVEKMDRDNWPCNVLTLAHTQGDGGGSACAGSRPHGMHPLHHYVASHKRLAFTACSAIPCQHRCMLGETRGTAVRELGHPYTSGRQPGAPMLTTSGKRKLVRAPANMVGPPPAQGSPRAMRPTSVVVPPMSHTMPSVTPLRNAAPLREFTGPLWNVTMGVCVHTCMHCQPDCPAATLWELQRLDATSP